MVSSSAAPHTCSVTDSGHCHTFAWNTSLIFITKSHWSRDLQPTMHTHCHTLCMWHIRDAVRGAQGTFSLNSLLRTYILAPPLPIKIFKPYLWIIPARLLWHSLPCTSPPPYFLEPPSPRQFSIIQHCRSDIRTYIHTYIHYGSLNAKGSLMSC